MEQSRILYIKSYLEKYTDEEHQATLGEVINWLEQQGIKATDKTVRADIDLLIEFGVDIIIVNKKPLHVFVGQNEFEVAEVKFLADAIQAARFITDVQRTKLITKLSNFVNTHQRKGIKRNLVTSRVNPVTTYVYNTVDLLNRAINNNKKVNFMYFDWLPNGKKVYKHDNRLYILSPYALIWKNDRYYAIGFSESHNKVATFRVDKMSDITVSDEKRIPKFKDFSVSHYVDKVFYMFSDSEDTVDVKLKCTNDLMFAVIDQFGAKITAEDIEEDTFCVTVNVVPTSTFLSWVFSFGGRMKIISPMDTIEKYHEMLSNAE